MVKEIHQHSQSIRSINSSQHQVVSGPSLEMDGELISLSPASAEGKALHRLVYRIYESSKPFRVWILSFAEHDLAYKRAIDRLTQNCVQIRRKKRKR